MRVVIPLPSEDLRQIGTAVEAIRRDPSLRCAPRFVALGYTEPFANTAFKPSKETLMPCSIAEEN